MDSRRSVLLAGLVPLMAEVRRVLEAHFVVFPAENLPQAQRRLVDDKPDCVVVAYHFDEIRLFRLTRHIRAHRVFDHVVITLVRVVPFRLGATPAEIARAYGELGVEQFFDLHDEVRLLGAQQALERFAAAVRNVLPKDPLAGPAGSLPELAPRKLGEPSCDSVKCQVEVPRAGEVGGNEKFQPSRIARPRS